MSGGHQTQARANTSFADMIFLFQISTKTYAMLHEYFTNKSNFMSGAQTLQNLTLFLF